MNGGGSTRWPPKESATADVLPARRWPLEYQAPTEDTRSAFDEYVSDPNKPVPYLGYTVMGMTPGLYDEESAVRGLAPDVLTYETEPLDADMTIAGTIKIKLQVSTTERIQISS